MHAHRSLGLQGHHLQEHMVMGMKTNPETYVKTPKGLKQLITFATEKKPTPLQYDNATPH